MNLNTSVLQYLQLNGLCTSEQIARGINKSVGQVRSELLRQCDSIASDFIIEVANNIYYMHPEAKQIPLRILNHICSSTYYFRRHAGEELGKKEKTKFRKEVLQLVNDMKLKENI